MSSPFNISKDISEIGYLSGHRNANESVADLSIVKDEEEDLGDNFSKRVASVPKPRGGVGTISTSALPSFHQSSRSVKLIKHLPPKSPCTPLQLSTRTARSIGPEKKSLNMSYYQRSLVNRL